MTEVFSLDNPRDVETDTRKAMSERDLIWDDGPGRLNVPAVGIPTGQQRIIQGRILSTVSGKTEFVGPFTDELAFCTAARHIVLDNDWKQ